MESAEHVEVNVICDVKNVRGYFIVPEIIKLQIGTATRQLVRMFFGMKMDVQELQKI